MSKGISAAASEAVIKIVPTTSKETGSRLSLKSPDECSQTTKTCLIDWNPTLSRVPKQAQAHALLAFLIPLDSTSTHVQAARGEQ